MLVDLARFDIIARGGEHAPVLRELERDLAGDALAALEESDFGLLVVIAVQRHQLPAIESRAAFHLDPADTKRVFVDQEARDDGVDAVGLVGDARHVVRVRLGEPAGDAGVDRVRHCERVLAEQLIGLPEQDVDEAGIVELGGVLHAGIQPGAAFDAVPA